MPETDNILIRKIIRIVEEVPRDKNWKSELYRRLQEVIVWSFQDGELLTAEKLNLILSRLKALELEILPAATVVGGRVRRLTNGETQ